ncbi:MAG TPA: hypothetical protein DCZ95_09200 [Verrucomicrobia bacterium]|nr:hypothetical protein [Verrucomicrobiota bacterium]
MFPIPASNRRWGFILRFRPLFLAFGLAGAADLAVGAQTWYEGMEEAYYWPTYRSTVASQGSGIAQIQTAGTNTWGKTWRYAGNFDVNHQVLSVGLGAVVSGRVKIAVSGSNDWNYVELITASRPGEYMADLSGWSGNGPADETVYVQIVIEGRGARALLDYVSIHSIERNDTLYVSPAGSHQAPFSSWAKASTSLQAAVDFAYAGSTIWVTDGVYNAEATYSERQTHCASRLVVAKPLTIRSVNGPDKTILEGQRAEENPIRCALLDYGAALDGFTLRGGSAYTNDFYNYSWGFYYGPDHESRKGGGAFLSRDARLINCRAESNTAVWGGGVYGGQLSRCRLQSNYSLDNGGGLCDSAASQCIIQNNSSGDGGGGAYNSVLRNCLVQRNHADWIGGGVATGTLYNCTVVDNTCKQTGGGIWMANCFNSIVYFNKAQSGSNWYAPVQLVQTCTWPLPDPAKPHFTILAADPGLISLANPRLAAGSPCIDAGNAGIEPGLFDLYGQTRVLGDRVDIGCSEFDEDAAGALSCSGQAAPSPTLVNYPVVFEGSVEGPATHLQWDWPDAPPTVGVFRTSHTFDRPGLQSVVFSAWNGDSRASCTVQVNVLAPFTNFVSPHGLHIRPYTNWIMAATNIQTAISDTVAPGATVMVDDGVYNTGTIVGPDGILCRMVITNDMTVVGRNGAEHTFIEGSGDGAAVAIRCAYIGPRASLRGVTLRKGSVLSYFYYFARGGGALCDPSARLVDCIISSNSAYYGGGTAYGILERCLVVNNSAQYYGGGCAYSTVSDSTIASNRSAYNGGGLYSGSMTRCDVFGNRSASGGGLSYSTASNCLIHDNIASGGGGGASSSTLNDCEITDNRTDYNGGGASSCNLNRCLVRRNRAVGDGGGISGGVVSNSFVTLNNSGRNGGGLCYGKAVNVTVTYNIASNLGAGAYQADCMNSILYFNQTAQGQKSNYEKNNNATEGRCSYCCAYPQPYGDHNIEADPYLVSTSSPLLWASSPCIDAGTNYPGTHTDFFGQPRFAGKAIDMGCQEFQSPPTSDVLHVGIDVVQGRVILGRPVVLAARILEAFTGLYWDWGTGPTNLNAVQVSHVFAAPGTYPVRLLVSNLATFCVATCQVSVLTAEESSTYVSLQGLHQWPFTNWVMAATNIQAAISANPIDGGFVWVSNGVYNSGRYTNASYGAARIAITNPLTVRSMNGPEYTCIAGSYAPAMRCVVVGTNAVLEGFTLTNGYSTHYAFAGGNVYCISNAVVRQCLITHGTANLGGGVYGGHLEQCIISNNCANTGSGAGHAVLSACTIVNNGSSFWSYGGGVKSCTVRHSVLKDNNAYRGGGSSSSQLFDSLLTGNSAEYGGGTYMGSSSNCIIEGGIASEGGGTYMSSTEATIVRSNTAYGIGGGGSMHSNHKGTTFIGNSTSGSGGGCYHGNLTDCALLDNRSTEGYGGGAYWSTAVGTLFQSNQAFKGGGVFMSVLSNCALSGNTASHGGGAFESTVDRSVIADNLALTNGGGVCESAVFNSTLRANRAEAGAGAYGSRLRNCAVVKNDAAYFGGGSAFSTNEFCTLTGNRAVLEGAGSYQDRVSSSIVYYNGRDGTNWCNSQFDHSCTLPAAAGAGNLDQAPGLLSLDAPRLAGSSSCIDRGVVPAGTTNAADLDGNPRATPVDMGCYEYTAGASASFDASLAAPPRIALGAEFRPLCTLTGAVMGYRVRLGDGSARTNELAPVWTPAQAGLFTVVLDAWNAQGLLSRTLAVEVVANPICYASLSGSHVAPFSSWATAATTLQAAAEACIPGGTVLAAAGRYDAGGIFAEGLMNRVFVPNAITVRSQSGPEQTFIVGHTRTRCVYLAEQSVLAGFTLQDGHAMPEQGLLSNQRGGGVYSLSGAVVSNCILKGNTALQRGGGGFNGTFVNSLIVDNQASQGGGAAEAGLRYCTVCDNHAAAEGGGLFGGRADYCIVYFNTAFLGGANSQWTTVTPLGLDPSFVDRPHDDYRLASGSPCIDAAEAHDAGPAGDLLGVPRLLDGNGDGVAAFDLGAFEFASPQYSSDPDAMPDAWELANGLNLLTVDGDLDLDGDGLVNEQEYISGSNPRDGQSFPAWSAAHEGLSFFASEGRVYDVQYRTNLLSGDWTNYQTGLPGHNAVLELTLPEEYQQALFRFHVRLP